MKKIVVAVVVVVLALLVAPWGVGKVAEKRLNAGLDKLVEEAPYLKVVERTIGHKRGTGGSSGVDFLRRALDLTFFPELYAVRSEIGE